MKSIKILLITVLFSLNAFCQTPGVVNFNYKTKAKSGNYSPKHVLATWIETESGVFVKTLKVRAKDRKKYLYAWISKSSQNTSDAITGSTLSSHISHSLSWNLTAVDGSLVPDGNYKIVTEFTSAHAQGPLLIVSFSKTGTEVNLTPDNETYFESISLSYVPESITGVETNLEAVALSIFPNPVKEDFTVRFTLDKSRDIQLNIYDSRLNLINNLYTGKKTAGIVEMSFSLNNLNLSEGIYYILVKSDSFQSAQKIIYTK